jgi:hypothetical protein
MGVFTNAESAECIMCEDTRGLYAKWKEHPLRQMQQKA